MKPILRGAATAAVLLALATPFGAAPATGTLTISAVVLSASNCKFRPGSGTLLDFGSIDPSSGTNKTATVTLVVRCQGSADPAAYNISSNDGLYALGAGQPRMRHTVNAAEYLPYTINTPMAGTVAKGVDTNVVLTGTVTPAQFNNAIAGAFADTVVLTLAP